MRAYMRTMLAVVAVMVVTAALLATATRAAEADASGPKLASLHLSGIGIGVFDPDTTSYAASTQSR